MWPGGPRGRNGRLGEAADYLLAEQLDVGDVAGAVDVQVDGVGALAAEVLDDPDEVVGVAGDAGREEAGAGLAEGLPAALEVGGVPADAGRHRGREADLGRVTADDVLADALEVGVALAELEAEGAVELVGVPRGQGGGALGARSADDDLGALDRAGDGGAVGQLVVLAVEAEPLPRLGVPETGENRELLFQPVEPFAEAGERDPEVLVLPFVPGGADAELGPAAAHLGDGGDLDRELAREPEGGGVDERAEPDPVGLDGQARQGGPRGGRRGGPRWVGPAGPARVVHESVGW